MIKLSYSPIAGSAVPVTLSFKDSNGAYYVPLSLNYTYLAMNSDEATWQVVSSLYQVSVVPKSVVGITIPSASTTVITGTTLQRKILVAWTALVNGQTTDFIDEVCFTLQEYPTISNTPSVDPTTPEALTVSSITYDPQSVNGNCTPNGTINLKFNVPLNEDSITVSGAVMFNGSSVTGTVSQDGLTWSYKLSDFTAGNYTLILANTITSALGGTYAGAEYTVTVETSLMMSSNIELSNASTESLTGTATTLNASLAEIVAKIKELEG